MARKRDLDTAAEQLTTIVERHLAALSPDKRKARIEAFGRLTAKVRGKYARIVNS